MGVYVLITNKMYFFSFDILSWDGSICFNNEYIIMGWEYSFLMIIDLIMDILSWDGSNCFNKGYIIMRWEYSFLMIIILY